MIVFSQFVCKTCQRQSAALKLCRLIVDLMFYKICKFENHVIKALITKNNREQWENADLGKVLMRAIQKCYCY